MFGTSTFGSVTFSTHGIDTDVEVTSTLEINYGIYTVVSSEFNIPYEVTAGTISVLDIPYEINNGIHSALDIRYEVQGSVERVLDIPYTVAGKVDSDLMLIWDINTDGAIIKGNEFVVPCEGRTTNICL